jgi:magnesium transporter
MNREELQATVRLLLASLNAQDITRTVNNQPRQDMAEVLEQHPDTAVAGFLMALPPALRADLFAHFDETRQDTLLRQLPREAMVNLFEQMPSDDRADLFNRLGEAARAQLLPALAKAERDDILRLAAYPENTVGSVTTSDYAAVAPELSVEQALAALRAGAPDKETIYVVYVLDAERRLLGTVSLRDLVLARPEQKVTELMKRDPVFARAQWPRMQAAELIRRYDLLALPVINGGERMIGIVTVDDAMDIEKEADTTQLARFGGTATLGGPDLDVLASPLPQMFKVRVFWLAILTFFGVVTSTFVAQQEELLASVIVLAAFIAPIVDMGGNTGSQSATLVIRAMALGDVRLQWRDVWLIVRRELPVALLLGLAIAVLEVVLAYFAKGVGWDVLMVVGLAMLVCTVLGGLIGALLPFIARRVGTDPATLSAPAITSVMDLLGVFIYFGLAYAFLGHLIVEAV